MAARGNIVADMFEKGSTQKLVRTPINFLKKSFFIQVILRRVDDKEGGGAFFYFFVIFESGVGSGNKQTTSLWVPVAQW